VIFLSLRIIGRRNPCATGSKGSLAPTRVVDCDMLGAAEFFGNWGRRSLGDTTPPFHGKHQFVPSHTACEPAPASATVVHGGPRMPA
jgi:hypothetical protein